MFMRVIAMFANVGLIGIACYELANKFAFFLNGLPDGVGLWLSFLLLIVPISTLIAFWPRRQNVDNHETKTIHFFVVGLAALFIGMLFGIWFNHQRFDDKIIELNASYNLDWAGQAFSDLAEWEHGYTNSVHDHLVLEVEYEMVALKPYVEAHPQSEVAARYYEMMENIRHYQDRFRWSSGLTNWDRDLDKVFAKTVGVTNH